ncbi:MAG: hypothetical protein H8E94_06140, partial [Alphaproteobacteria bacterium]|nr:hypothetical protein [Alphaproteobacteria bacterium]
AWQRPWRVNARRKTERVGREARGGRPDFSPPTHTRYTYDPIRLKDFQKNELIMTPGTRRKAEKEKQDETGDILAR